MLRGLYTGKILAPNLTSHTIIALLSRTSSSYTQSKIDEKFTVTDEQIFRVYEAFDRKNNSHTDLRTSHAQLSEKGCQYREGDSENKILS